MTPRYVVAAYEMDRVYGGPEEGGWWFDTGELIRPLRIFRSEEDAYSYCRRVNRSLAHKREVTGVRSLSSVAYDGGHVQALVFDDVTPRCFPEERPHYE